MPEFDLENVQCGKALCRIAKGDCSALDVIYEAWGRRIFFLALSILHNYSDAEDVTSETLLEVAGSAARFTPGSNARAWVTAIARNLALKKLRDRECAADLSEHESDAALLQDDAYSEYELLSLLRRTLAPEDQRIVLLHVYGGYKFREIAQMTDMTVESVKKRSQRAMKKLAEQLSPDDPKNKKGETKI